ncbi:hypothetical protein J2TS6_16960 [Paenibacillus albilobatus]|uniref:Uncharacterized protein n=1 Tax=Paenibacillus albilobatus TaxID=2716884 RepID=A0A919XGJ1_9BACL|nr:hypothetical protein J2TS6_16960 [Paenibacillus albilobatus]
MVSEVTYKAPESASKQKTGLFYGSCPKGLFIRHMWQAAVSFMVVSLEAFVGANPHQA